MDEYIDVTDVTLVPRIELASHYAFGSSDWHRRALAMPLKFDVLMFEQSVALRSRR
jgi:hypothetical protein